MSLTLNGVNATITFHDNNWELTIKIGNNEASTYGMIKYEPPIPVQEPIEIPVQEPYNPREPVSDSNPMMNALDKKHEQILYLFFNDISSANNRENKAKCAAEMFKFMTNEGLRFVNKFKVYRLTTISKAYEFKLQSEGVPELIQAIDEYLTAIGEPLEDPIQKDRIDIALINKIAIELGLPIVHPDDYLKNFRAYISNEEIYIDSDEKKRQEMRRYLENLHKVSKSEDARKDLMMSIFQKKNIEFNDNVMQMYYKWEKTAPRLNRFKKMCLFIEQL